MSEDGGNGPSHDARCVVGIIFAMILGAMAGIGVAPVIAPDFVIELAVLGAAAYGFLTAVVLC